MKQNLSLNIPIKELKKEANLRRADKIVAINQTVFAAISAHASCYSGVINILTF